MELVVRKHHFVLQEIFHEGGPPRNEPLRMGAAAAVIRNPFAGRYEPEIAGFMEDLKPLGKAMALRLMELLGGREKIEAYGKAAMVGTAGELEHGGLWHVPGGYAMREALGEARAIVPSAKKVTHTGGAIDVPIHHINAAYVRSHFNAFEVSIPDAPRPDELVYILAMTTGPRVHARIGGLTPEGISVLDGQR